MELNFAIIGCGNITPRHAENIEKHGRLAAVCDIVKEKADQLATMYHANSYDSIDNLLAKEKAINIAVICTPNGLHATHAIAALKAGKHVLCEKPMCLTKREGMQMMEAAQRSGKKLFVVKQNRYNPPVLQVKKWIDEGRLGKIVSVQVNGFWNRDENYFKNTWKGTKEMDGGILFTQFSHFIDLAYWLAGDIKEVKTIKKNLLLEQVIETEDNFVAIAEFQNGALGSFHFSINSYRKNMEGSVTIIAEKGTVKIGGQYLNTLEYQDVEGLDPVILEKSNPANNYGFYEGSMSNHHLVYENMIKALADDQYSLANVDDGMKTVEIIEKMYATCT